MALKKRPPRRDVTGAAGTTICASVPTFYRVVRHSPQQAQDFTSNRDKGLTKRGPEVDDPSLWEGISVYMDRGRAERQAVRYRLGEFIARLDIPEEPTAGVAYQKTLADPHHFTLWGEPSTLLQHVREVTPIRE